MELLYIWIKDDGKNIKNQGFNFSPRYWFKFDEKTNTLTCEKQKPELADIFKDSNIANVTAIVGENGTGKSNLLDNIIKIHNTDNSFEQIITVFRKQEKCIKIK